MQVTNAGDDRSGDDRIVERVRAIPEGFVRTYGDIDPRAPRRVGLVLARTRRKPAQGRSATQALAPRRRADARRAGRSS